VNLVSIFTCGVGILSLFGTYQNTCIPYLTNISHIIFLVPHHQSFHKHPQVNPVTHAVGNTIKRVVIIVASVVAFKTPMSTGSIIGSSVAIAGTLMYSLAMNASKTKKD